VRFRKDLNGRKLLLFLFLLRTSHPSCVQGVIGSGHCSGHGVYHDAFATLGEGMESPHQAVSWFRLGSCGVCMGASSLTLSLPYYVGVCSFLSLFQLMTSNYGLFSRAGGFEHTFVHHPRQYSHLRKFSYTRNRLVISNLFPLTNL
jgi:hypothetical protein